MIISPGKRWNTEVKTAAVWVVIMYRMNLSQSEAGLLTRALLGGWMSVWPAVAGSTQYVGWMSIILWQQPTPAGQYGTSPGKTLCLLAVSLGRGGGGDEAGRDIIYLRFLILIC